MPIATIHGRSTAAGFTQCGIAAAREMGVYTSDIQKRIASALSVEERRLVKMNEEA